MFILKHRSLVRPIIFVGRLLTFFFQMRPVPGELPTADRAEAARLGALHRGTAEGDDGQRGGRAGGDGRTDGRTQRRAHRRAPGRDSGRRNHCRRTVNWEKVSEFLKKQNGFQELVFFIHSLSFSCKAFILELDVRWNVLEVTKTSLCFWLKGYFQFYLRKQYMYCFKITVTL